MTHFDIRPAREDDCSTIAAMVLLLAAQHGVASGTTSAGLMEAAFGDHATIEMLVASSDGQVIGYLIHQDTYSTWRGANGVFVVDLYVDPVWRGSGVGEALMKAAARRGVQKGARFIRLDIDVHNAAAARFYERLGFREQSDDRFRSIEFQGMTILADPATVRKE